jgi:hypothetical protein
MTDNFDAKHGGKLAFGFGVVNAVTNKTNEDLTVADVSQGTLSRMPHAGSVIGITVKPSADVSAGTVTFKGHEDGTEFTEGSAPAPVLNATNSQGSQVEIRPGLVNFDAGANLGVSYTSTTDAAPTNTNDYSVQLIVQFDPV